MAIDGHILDLDEFLAVMRIEFEGEIDERRIVPDARLVHDLDLDSLGLLRIITVVESLGDVTIPDQLDPGDATLADLHHYYAVSSERAGASSPAP